MTPLVAAARTAPYVDGDLLRARKDHWLNPRPKLDWVKRRVAATCVLRDVGELKLLLLSRIWPSWCRQ